MKVEFPECGLIVGTHGCRGEVRMESYCDTPEVLAGLKTLYRKTESGMTPIAVLRARVHNGQVIAVLENVPDMNTAQQMRGVMLFARRSDLPIKDGGALFSEIIGLPVIDAIDGKEYGKVTEVVRGAASDLYTVKTPTGNVLFPAVPAFIHHIDIENGVFVTPIPGIFDEAEEIHDEV